MRRPATGHEPDTLDVRRFLTLVGGGKSCVDIMKTALRVLYLLYNTILPLNKWKENFIVICHHSASVN